MRPETPVDRRAGAHPATKAELFRVFNGLALRGFGGVLPFAQHALVEERRWISQEDFADMLALAQVLPGPNICNLALMIGDRFFGLAGAFTALAGMLAAPMVLVLGLAVLYNGVGSDPLVARMLAGMSAVSAGLILAMAFKLLRTQRGRGPLAWLAVAAVFVAVGWLRWPLIAVLAVGIPLMTLLSWRRRPDQQPGKPSS